MKRKRIGVLTVTLLLLCAPGAFPQAAPATGSIEFEARVRPSGGRAEPILKMSFYLLRKSFQEIRAEAANAEARPDFEKFVDELPVSAELRAWMKRTQWANLSGTDFSRRLTNDDIFEVPEFLNAYLARNAGDTSVGFPKSKARDADRSQNPQKYEADQKAYFEALRNFLRKNPYTRDGIDVHLADINPGQRWQRRAMDSKRRAAERARELAETTYLVARAETDLQGQGRLAAVAAGDYWLSTLDDEAVVGDSRLQWDVPVPVRAGRITRLTLSNVNAVSRR